MTIDQQLQFIIDNMAMKDDIANMATKDDIANMATKDDIANMATKDDIANMMTKDDIESVRMELYDELNRQYLENDKRFTRLEVGINTLLQQSDNTNILLRLFNQQADELEMVKTRVYAIEKKLA